MSLAIVYSDLDDAVRAINAKLIAADEAEGKSTKTRIAAGQMLIALRQRIEAGEAGDGVKWWPWYKSKFGRSRKDAEKIMRLAEADDPEAAHEEERKKGRDRDNTRNGARSRGNHNEHNPNRVAYIIHLIEELTDEQRDELFAALEEKYP